MDSRLLSEGLERLDDDCTCVEIAEGVAAAAPNLVVESMEPYVGVETEAFEEDFE